MIDEIVFHILLHCSPKSLLNLCLVNKQFYNICINNYLWVSKFKNENLKNLPLIKWVNLYYDTKINRIVDDIQLPIINIFNDIMYKSIIIDPNDCQLSEILPYVYYNVEDKNKLHYFYITFYDTKEWIFDIVSAAPRYRYVINKNKVIQYLKTIYIHFEVEDKIHDENIWLTLKN